MSLADAPRPAAPDPRALNQAAMRALASGDAAGARRMLVEAVALDPAAVPLQLNLAAACRALGDLGTAMGAIDAALAADPRNFLGLLMKAAVLERQGRTREAGAAYGVALTQTPPADQLDAATRTALELGRKLNAEYLVEMERFLSDVTAGARAMGKAAESRRINTFIERLTGRRAVYQQQPTHFAYPGMPSIEFYERDLFPWLTDLEAATVAIRAELLNLLTEEGPDKAFEPYIEYPDGVPLDQWAELNHSQRWSAFHLFKAGAKLTANCDRCPVTIATLAALPQPQAPGRSPASMFSLLQPRTRIPAHTGVSNTRVVVHLPLVIPPGCGFRVGSETREWALGHAWVFDDTIDHEAWNNSPQPRAILIFDVWSPFLSENEREMVVRVMNAMDDFHGVTPADSL
jgi:aspartyl/asparaginyl beta-hydroxylase (cupin superfamily)